jgi:hypothetical protein
VRVLEHDVERAAADPQPEIVLGRGYVLASVLADLVKRHQRRGHLVRCNAAPKSRSEAYNAISELPSITGLTGKG